jgi:hypothetical protein
MLEDGKCEHGPGTSETCREPRRAKQLVCKEITAGRLIALAIRNVNQMRTIRMVNYEWGIECTWGSARPAIVSELYM